MKAIIPAAGLGTRFLPATKSVPKEMLPVLGKPMIQYVVEEALRADIDGVVVVSNASKKALEEHFRPDEELVSILVDADKDDLADKVREVEAMGERVTFVYQESPRGLGDAVYSAALETGDEPFYVLLGDVIVPEADILATMKSVSDVHGGANVIAVMPVPMTDVARYGVIAGVEVSQGVWRVTGLVEKPAVFDAPSNLVVFGRYLLSPKVMRILETVEPGAGGEIQLTDAMAASLAEEEMYAVVIDPAAGFDTGTIPAWIVANTELARRQRITGHEA